MVGTRDYVNSTLVKMKPRRHRLFTRPRPMAQQHSPPYSSPSPMWLIVVSSAVVTRHRGRPQPSSSSSASSITSPPPLPLYCCAFLLLDGKITKTSSLLDIFSHEGHFFVWLSTQDPQFSPVVARACKIHVRLRR
jgi:hypothetical protein